VRLALVAVADDLHLAGLGLLSNWDRQHQHAVLVPGVDSVGVETFAQEQLPCERPVRPLAHNHLVAFGRLPPPAGPDRQDLLLHRQIHRVGIDAGKVHRNLELVIVSPSVHR